MVCVNYDCEKSFDNFNYEKEREKKRERSLLAINNGSQDYKIIQQWFRLL